VVIAGLGVWWWVSQENDPKAVVEREARQAFAQARREEWRFQSGMPWLGLLDELKARLFKNQRRSSDPGQRLGALGPDVIPLLSKALAEDKSVAVRKLAAEVSGRLGEWQSIPALTNALLHDVNDQVRQAAAGALGQIASPETLLTALQAFQSETNNSVRWQIASLLGNLRDARAVPALVAALQADTQTASAAASALGEIGDASAVPGLAKAARTNPDARTRSEAVSAARKCG